MTVGRRMGCRGWISLGTRIDGLHRKLRRPSVGQDVNRSDMDGGIWVEGAARWSGNHTLWSRLGGRWRTFEDREGTDTRGDRQVHCYLVQTGGFESWELCRDVETAQWTLARRWARKYRAV